MTTKNRFRALRNLFLALALAFLAWGLRGWPLPLEMELHRAERQNLAPESDVIWTYKGTRFGDRDMVVGVSEGYLTAADGRSVCFWPRSITEPTLIGLPFRTRYSPDGKAHSYLDASFLLVDAPEETARAKLTMTISYNDWQEDYEMEGEKQGEAWFFQLQKRYYGSPDNRLQDCEESAFSLLWSMSPGLFGEPYKVELYDQTGACIGTVCGNGFPQ